MLAQPLKCTVFTENRMLRHPTIAAPHVLYTALGGCRKFKLRWTSMRFWS